MILEVLIYRAGQILEPVSEIGPIFKWQSKMS